MAGKRINRTLGQEVSVNGLSNCSDTRVSSLSDRWNWCIAVRMKGYFENNVKMT